MKKTNRNYYFIFSASIMLFFAFYLLFNIDSLLSQQYVQISEPYASEEYFSLFSEYYQNGGLKTIMMIYAILHVILNTYILCSTLDNHLLRNKGKIIAASLICFFTYEFEITLLLSLVNVIILLLSKRKNPEDFPEEKEALPIREPVGLTKKQIIWLSVFVIVYLSEVVLGLVLPETISTQFLMVLSMVYYAVLLLLAIICLVYVFQDDFILLFHHKKAYYHHVLPIVGIMYLTYFSVSIAIAMIMNDTVSMNQTMIAKLPIYITAPLAIIWAPIVEETLYRGVLRKIISHNNLFIVVSGFIFGIAHTLSEGSIIRIISLAIPYSILGFFLAYIYTKTDNISNNILVHAFHNFLGVCILAILKG